MDKATVKTVLSAYRAGRRDADDPAFAEALREVERDPELAAWFAEQQRFDALMTATLRQVPAPPGLKELILLNTRFPNHEARPASDWKRRARNWLPLAACVALAFVLGRQTQPASHGRGDGGNPLALQAIAYTGKMPALQFVCFDAEVVAQWVDKKSAALGMGKLLEKPMSNMQMIGSSTARWQGKPVVMIALQQGDQMAMLYLVRASDFPGVAPETDEIMEKDGYVTQTRRRGGHVSVLTTKGTRENLKFPLPL